MEEEWFDEGTNALRNSLLTEKIGMLLTAMLEFEKCVTLVVERSIGCI